ncbi:MAG TPA: hypothetical protein VMF67_06055 [Rhizomicrobium sp.]|nr:hypothetical protein [Rhizomicrobium sp.]
MEIKFYAQESDFYERKEIVRLVAIALQEEQRFGDNGFTGQNYGDASLLCSTVHACA